ncbi:MAG: cysteine synthase family protein [Candidatus Methanofastidiosia archaeon]
MKVISDYMVEWDVNRRVAQTMLDTIGRTPLVRLQTIPKQEKVTSDILGKVEWFSPTGSLKDRIYYEMITHAVEEGDLNPGMEILETSTGNAGISCAFVGGLLGFKVTIVMPAGMSEERKKVISAYGANLVYTPGGESDVDLCLEKARELKRKNPGKYWEPGQFVNDYNIRAHYKNTGPEIWEQTQGKVDAFIASQGTGGTITGVGRYLREKNPLVKLYALEPSEAPMLARGKWGSHRIEGIGDGFVPRTLDVSMLDGVILTTSEEAILMARRLAKEEGMFCGISSGCNVAGAIKLARNHPELRTIVTMINDTGQRYFSTELCGGKKDIDIPEREHMLDGRTIENLDKYQKTWEIIE